MFSQKAYNAAGLCSCKCDLKIITLIITLACQLRSWYEGCGYNVFKLQACMGASGQPYQDIHDHGAQLAPKVFDFPGGREIGGLWEKPLWHRREPRHNSTHIWPWPGIKPGPQWQEVSALRTSQPCNPIITKKQVIWSTRDIYSHCANTFQRQSINIFQRHVQKVLIAKAKGIRPEKPTSATRNFPSLTN